MGDSGRLRAFQLLYVGVVLILATGGVTAARPELTTLALVLTLPAGFGYGPLSLLIPLLPGTVAGSVTVVLIGALAVLNLVVLRWLRRVLPADPAAAGVEDRLARTLVGAGVVVTPVARRSERVRSDSGEVRVERSLDLRDLPMPYRDLLVMFGAMWQRAGLRVQDRPDPPGVRAYDEQGYEFLVEPGPYGEAVLQVASPALRERGFLAGALTGGVPSVVLVTLGLLLYAAAGGDRTDPLLSAVYPLVVACVVLGPLSLLAGVLCLFRFASRAFGRGLLLGGTPCLLVAMFYTAPLVLVS